MSNEPERLTPNAGAPSEHAGIISEPAASGLKLLSRLHDDQFINLRKDVVMEILDAECKAAVAAALEQAAEYFIEERVSWLKANGLSDPDRERGCACYGNDDSDSHASGCPRYIAAKIRALSPDPNYIALREAEARIAELQDEVKRFTDLRRQERIRVAGRHSDRFAASDIAESEVSQFHSPITDTLTNVVTLLGLDIAALNEARDRIAKETK